MATPIPFLLYHSIDDNCTGAYRRWMMKPAEFEAHMHVLRDAGYTPITVSDLAALRVAGLPVPASAAVITFDDGLRDFLTGAMPILSDFGFAATLYVVSGRVGGTSTWLSPLGEGGRRMLDWSELRDLAAAGIEIGAHTVSHPELDVLSTAWARHEIEGSKKKLEDGLQRPITSFAYPHGYASSTTRRLVREAGFQSACRVGHAFSTASEDLFALSRIIMTSGISADNLSDMLSKPALPVSPPVYRPLAEAWRAYRRLRFGTRVFQNAGG